MAHRAPQALPPRMSYEEYRQLPEDARAEWIGGDVMMVPSPSFRHQQAVRRLANLLEAALPRLVTVSEVTVRLSADYEPIPDIVVITREPAGEHIDETPVIAVEVLSPSNADYDTVVKSELYRQAGVGQYWVVDPRNRTIAVFENTGAKWRQVAALSDDAPSDIVRVGERDQVEVDLPRVLGPR